MATVTSKGKKKITTNDGSVQVNINDNRLLQFDGTNYRLIIGSKPTGEGVVSNVTQISKPGDNVVNI